MNTQSNKVPNRGREIWAALFHVRAREGNSIFKGARGAFVPALALAKDDREAVSLISKKLDSYDLEVIEFEDVVSLAKKMTHTKVPAEMLRLAGALTDENPVAFGGFHLYERDTD